MRRKRVLSIALLTLLGSGGIAFSSSNSEGKPTQGKETKQSKLRTTTGAEDKDQPRMKLDASRLELDQKRLELDREKLQFEQQSEKAKLDVEREKARWSAIASIVPIAVALLTIIVSISTLFVQAKLQRESLVTQANLQRLSLDNQATLQRESLEKQARLQRESFENQADLQREAQLATSKLEFDMKVAEIVFAAKSAEAVRVRLGILEKLFPERIPKGMSETFDPMEYGGGYEPKEDKHVFLEQLLKYPSQREHILAFWKQLFPYDSESERWLTRVLLPNSNDPAEQSATNGSLEGKPKEE